MFPEAKNSSTIAKILDNALKRQADAPLELNQLRQPVMRVKIPGHSNPPNAGQVGVVITPETTQSESESSSDSEANDAEESLRQLSGRLAAWGMQCLESPQKINRKDALLFISRLDPAIDDYKSAAKCVTMLGGLRGTGDTGSYIDGTDKSERTALILAVLATQKSTEMGVKHYDWNLDLIKRLIKIGVPVNHSDKNGKTALMYAIKFGLPKVAEVLLDHGADIAITDNKKHNVWWHAIANAESKEIFILLRSFSKSTAPLNQADDQGKTPLMCAIESADRENYEKTFPVQLLLRYGGNPTIADTFGNNAWIYAAKSEIPCFIEMLGRYDNLGTANNAANKKGETALSIIEDLLKNSRNDMDDLSFIRDNLFRYGATRTNSVVARQYGKLRQLEALLLSEFVSIKTRVTQLYARELAKLEAQCAEKLSGASDSGPNGGIYGDRYFKFYTSNIVEPVLSEFFKSLRKVLTTTKIDKELFAPVFFQIMLEQLGLMRKQIHQVATVSNPRAERPFGDREFSQTVLIDHLDVYKGWRKHVRHEIKKHMYVAFEECRHRKTRLTMRKVLEQMLGNTSYILARLATENSYIFSSEKSGKFKFGIPPEVMNKKELTLDDLKHMNLDSIKCYHQSHRIPSRETIRASMHLLNAILHTDERSLQTSLKTDLFHFMEHTYKASYLARGQASFAEWVVAGVSGSHGLVFEYPEWKTRIDRSNLALDHQFLSDFDGTLRDRFMKTASFKTTAQS